MIPPQNIMFNVQLYHCLLFAHIFRGVKCYSCRSNQVWMREEKKRVKRVVERGPEIPTDLTREWQKKRYYYLIANGLNERNIRFSLFTKHVVCCMMHDAWWRAKYQNEMRVWDQSRTEWKKIKHRTHIYSVYSCTIAVGTGHRSSIKSIDNITKQTINHNISFPHRRHSIGQ